MTDSPNEMLEMGLFTGAPQHTNFCRIKELAPTATMTPSPKPYTWPEAEALSIPETYTFNGEERSSEKLLVDTDTAALLVIVDGAIRYEQYWLTGGPDVNWLSMSVAKSFISALVGIAIAEGRIENIDDPISRYVPVNPGSAYDGVPIRTVLQMSSGARWNEDYSDTESDIFQVSMAMLGVGGGLDDFVARMVREHEPETVCRYNSGETQILGALIARATGHSVADYMQEKLVNPLGFESPGYWVTDLAGTEMSYAGLNLTARDFARLGELYRNEGSWQGRQIVDEQWVRDSTSINSAIREPGKPLVGDHAMSLGYGYQWWIPAGDRGGYSAIGVLNQFVYVDPETESVIVKLSANRNYGTANTEEVNRDAENVEFLRAIAQRAH
ncbi:MULTISPECIES: serine hydrolase domain-containing protein [unclassified Brevibacterium]|uniref:serine hydrolase domain-containing protein n=1 Tax=unclassified Brevibacterium TaxID=2614124 RepID=UPI0010925BA2|nr:serine hydrolase [Brevibacterium sp. S22]TGD32256.1 class C beta-lactamase-related serine hydrolase [Brevibacterium sp. S22]